MPDSLQALNDVQRILLGVWVLGIGVALLVCRDRWARGWARISPAWPARLDAVLSGWALVAVGAGLVALS